MLLASIMAGTFKGAHENREKARKQKEAHFDACQRHIIATANTGEASTYCCRCTR